MPDALTMGRETRQAFALRDRSRAFAAARAHSRSVALMKRLIVISSAGGIIGLIAVAVIDPFSVVPANVSISAASLSGTKITMELPKLNGFRRDGKPYEVRARSGVQDVRTPKIIELNEVEARIQVESDNTVNVIAPFGVFDSGTDLMKLSTRHVQEHISLKSTSGFTVMLRSGEVNLKAGTLKSSDPVSVVMPNGTVNAESVDVDDNGRHITFTGNVRSLFNPPATSGAPAAE